VITLQSVMLVALGLFFAAFLGLLLAPLYRRRAARLAIEELKLSMPMTEAEIRADKDRLRAEYAIAIHKLETKLEANELTLAHQKVEINRRDGVISGLEGEVARLGTVLDEHENARRVLEQTIVERLPKVERRLSEAKQLLSERDQEILELSATAEQQAAALEETRQINTKQREDLHRLNATLATRAAHNRGNFRDETLESEIALRAELESLRAKTRDQSDLIKSLQSGTQRIVPVLDRKRVAASTGDGTDRDEVANLTMQLEEAQRALQEAKGETSSSKQRRTGLQKDLDDANAKLETQGKEVARLKAALNTYQSADDEVQAVKESKVALKARLSALQAENESQAETLRRLRSEVAAANDKLARQASYYVEEMRRLGGGTRPTGAATRTGSHTGDRTVRKPGVASLMDRISAPRKDGQVLTGSTGVPLLDAANEVTADPKVSGFIRALGGETPSDGGDQAVAASVNDNASNADVLASQPQTGGGQPATPSAPTEPAKSDTSAPRRPGLLERLTGTDKPSA
jgi:hypothetical protein